MWILIPIGIGMLVYVIGRKRPVTPNPIATRSPVPSPPIKSSVPVVPFIPAQTAMTVEQQDASLQSILAQSALAPFLGLSSRTAVVTTKTDPLNVRNAPSSSGAIVARAAKGSTVTVIGELIPGGPGSWAGWLPVTTKDGISGFAASEYLT